jgi:hypothetical protein
MTPEQIMALAFQDELEKIAGMPRYLKDKFQGGISQRSHKDPRKRAVSKYMAEVARKNSAGKDVARLIAKGSPGTEVAARSRDAGRAADRAKSELGKLTRSAPRRPARDKRKAHQLQRWYDGGEWPSNFPGE